MAKLDSKRERLFYKFSNNLHLLVENEIIDKDILKYENTYVCPICLNPFSLEDLAPSSSNQLTLEDAPPKSLNGNQIALTCKKCNNTCGHKIDFHLTEMLRELDFRDRIEGATKQGTFTALGKTVRGEIRVNSDKSTDAYHTEKNNNPKELKEYLEIVAQNVGKKDIVNFKPKPHRIIPKNLQIALLKTGYIIMFEKFGYALTLNSEFDQIRKQLLNPDKNIYPINCWYDGDFPTERYGISFITEEKLESVFVLFCLQADKVERKYAVTLPFVGRSTKKIIKEFNKKFETDTSLSIKMEGFDSEENYLENIEAIKNLMTWINNLEKYPVQKKGLKKKKLKKK